MSPDHLVVPELDAVTGQLGLRIEQVLRRTSKTLLVAGALAETPVVVKLLLDDDEFWRAKWRHEIDVYQTFAAHPPPVLAPRLVHTDGARLLVLERLDARPLDSERYPDRQLSDTDIDRVLAAVGKLNAWQPPPGRFAPIFDYPARVSRYHAAGYLTAADRDALKILLGRLEDRRELDHGDPLPSNLLLTADGDCAMVDWEFTGLFLPGFDLAMLYLLLGARTPAACRRIDQAVAEGHNAEAFAVNLAMAATRELRIHRELPDGPVRTAQLALLEECWTQARERLQQTAGRRS